MLTMPPNVDVETMVARIDAAIRELEAVRRQITIEAKSPTNPQPIAIEGWLKDFKFTASDIAQARLEMWGNLNLLN